NPGHAHGEHSTTLGWSFSRTQPCRVPVAPPPASARNQRVPSASLVVASADLIAMVRECSAESPVALATCRGNWDQTRAVPPWTTLDAFAALLSSQMSPVAGTNTLRWV